MDPFTVITGVVAPLPRVSLAFSVILSSHHTLVRSTACSRRNLGRGSRILTTEQEVA